MATVYAGNVFWWKAKDKLPPVNRIVLVRGGVALHEGTVWRTQTAEDSGREIQWPVVWWANVPETPTCLVDQA